MTFETTVSRLNLTEGHADSAHAPDAAPAPLGAPASLEADIAPLAAIWESSGDRYIEHHPGWAKLLGQSQGLCLHAFTTTGNARIDSYALVEEGNAALLWLLGEVRVFRKPIERLRVVGGQTFVPDLGPEQRRERARELLARLAREARGRPIFLQSLPVDSPLRELIRSRQHRFWVMSHGVQNTHFSIDLPDSVAAFYEGIGYTTRKSIRHTVRKLEKETKGNLLFKSFSRVEDVSKFIDDAITISKKTYQYRLLRMGIRDRDTTISLFTRMAERGWWRGYILYCNEEPAAFGYGYRIGSTFYYWEAGYDPKWTKWSVGTVATVKLAELLITSADRALRLDFLYGDHDYKKRLSNNQCEEQSFYLFPRSWRTFLVFYSLQITNRVSHQTGVILDRYELKSRLKRVVRRRAIRG